LDSGRQVIEFSGDMNYRGEIQAPLVAFSPDGRYIAVPTVDHSISLFDLSSGKKIASLIDENIYDISLPPIPPQQGVSMSDFSRPLRRGFGDVAALAFSSDSRYLTAAYCYQERRATFGGGVVFRDGETLVTQYTVRPEDLVSEACSHLKRNLTSTEWKQYLDGETYQKTCPSLP